MLLLLLPFVAETANKERGGRRGRSVLHSRVREERKIQACRAYREIEQHGPTQETLGAKPLTPPGPGIQRQQRQMHGGLSHEGPKEKEVC